MKQLIFYKAMYGTDKLITFNCVCSHKNDLIHENLQNIQNEASLLVLPHDELLS